MLTLNRRVEDIEERISNIKGWPYSVGPVKEKRINGESFHYITIWGNISWDWGIISFSA
jgi:hypothetical protein